MNITSGVTFKIVNIRNLIQKVIKAIHIYTVVQLCDRGAPPWNYLARFLTNCFFFLQIIGVTIGVVTPIHRIMVGDNAPLRVIANSLSLLGYECCYYSLLF